MAWTTPMTWVAGTVVTAAQGNAQWRDNFNQTAPALVTAANQILVSTGANALAARQFTSGYVATGETGTGTTLGGNLTTFGPWVAVNTGTQALVAIYAQMYSSVTSGAVYSTYGVTNATTIADSFDRCIGGAVSLNPGLLAGATFLQTGLTPGTNQFTMHYAVGSGTGSWTFRRIFVMPL
jgi:hypothetical protein